MEYKKKQIKSSKERKNGLQKALSLKPARSNSFVQHKTDYRNGKRHSAVSSTFFDINHDKGEVSSLTIATADTSQLSPNGQPFFCDKEKSELINHPSPNEPNHVVVEMESTSKYRRLQKMFSVPFSSTTTQDIDEENSMTQNTYEETTNSFLGRYTMKIHIYRTR
jgi:hypothetical protein